eukprot:3771733-Ditylum_brightwellii.AAC.1
MKMTRVYTVPRLWEGFILPELSPPPVMPEEMLIKTFGLIVCIVMVMEKILNCLTEHLNKSMPIKCNNAWL